MDPIHSIYEDDPDMLEIIREFVADAGSRASDLERYLETAALAELQTLAHQLKGAGGGYGFASITDLAASLEQAVKHGLEIEVVKDRCSGLCDVLRSIVIPEEG